MKPPKGKVGLPKKVKEVQVAMKNGKKPKLMKGKTY